MRNHIFVILAAMMLANLSYVNDVKAQDRSPAALTGIVSSNAEGPMEGVLVTAKSPGSTIAVTVVSNVQGHYSFPADRLEPAMYQLTIRAVGYELHDPDSAIVEIGKKTPVTVDIKLDQTQDLASQLSNTEWLLSVPGSHKQKMQLYRCVNCHSLNTITKSRYNAEGFMAVLTRMGTYAPGSMILKLGDRRIPYASILSDREADTEGYSVPGGKEFAEFLATINLSSSKDGKWNYKFVTAPRPSGRATNVIITQYDLPSPLNMPHDVEVDSEGMVWYTDFARPRIGRLNPHTGGVTEWPLPVFRPEEPEGSLDIELDENGNPWIGRLFQGGVAKFDIKTEKVTAWSVPEELLAGGVNARTGMIAVTPDGTIWTKSNQAEKLYRLDQKTGKWSGSDLPEGQGWYGMDASPAGDKLYIFSLGKGAVGEIALKDVGKKPWDVYPTPTPNSGSRRGAVDTQGRAWFAEFNSGKIGMFDPKTKQIKEWAASTEQFAGSYDAAPDMNGEVWAGGMHSDHAYRVNPTTNEVTGYLLPDVGTNIRRMNTDSNVPVSVWIGQNHGGKILKLEPLD